MEVDIKFKGKIEGLRIALREITDKYNKVISGS